jgi:hypothetical protein
VPSFLGATFISASRRSEIDKFAVVAARLNFDRELFQGHPFIANGFMPRRKHLGDCIAIRVRILAGFERSDRVGSPEPDQWLLDEARPGVE